MGITVLVIIVIATAIVIVIVMVMVIAIVIVIAIVVTMTQTTRIVVIIATVIIIIIVNGSNNINSNGNKANKDKTPKMSNRSILSPLRLSSLEFLGHGDMAPHFDDTVTKEYPMTILETPYLASHSVCGKFWRAAQHLRSQDRYRPQ